MIDVHVRKKLATAQGTFDILFDLEIQKGEIVGFFGESGNGKSSLLRMIAGLMEPDEGTISINGNTWFDKENKINIKPHKRALGFMFQDYALFPHLNVEKNISFNASDESWINELLKIIDLTGLRHHYPGTLSGGQKQRVAFARALAARPDILLLDEPFSALDVRLRNFMQNFLVEVNKKLKATTIIVSHDLLELLKVADRIIFFEKGRAVLIKTTREVMDDESILPAYYPDFFNLWKREKLSRLHRNSTLN